MGITGVDAGETMVIVLAEAAGQATLTEGGQQRKLMKFMIDELSKKFTLAENQPQPVNAPGTSGWFGVILLLVLSSATFALTIAKLLAGE